MPKYGVYVTYKETAYVTVEAKDEEEAEEKGYELVQSGSGEPYGNDEDYDIEVERLDD